MFPTIEFSKGEVDRGAPDGTTVDHACALFSQWGTIRVVNVFSPDFVRSMSHHFHRRYGSKLTSTTKDDRRPLFSPEVAGPFADPNYHANPLLIPIVKRLLGDDFILGAFGAVVSFPGAPEQFIHRDSKSLYDDFSIDVRLPSYALTVLFPLVDANQETGSTRVWPGTHRVPSFEEARAMPSDSPDVLSGSALMTDSRTLHGGSPNRSQTVRPIVYNAYHRSWFRDKGGYETRPAVHVGNLRLLRMPGSVRRLFRIPRESSDVERIQWEIKRVSAGVAEWPSARAVRRLVKNALGRGAP